MLNVTVVYFGAPKEAFFRAALDEYEKRLSRFCRFTEKCLKPEKLPDDPNRAQIEKALAAEGERIAEVIPRAAYVIAMCVEGKTRSSEQLAELLEELPNGGVSDIVFVIGSSYGLSETVKKNAAMRLSMSPMTFAHSLALVMLAEQVYRAFTIINGDKYHK